MQFVVLALLLLSSGFAQAKDLSVNNSGSPACSDATTYTANNAANPWCTIGRAAWGSTNPNGAVAAQAAQAGDVVLISAGTYTTLGPQTACERWGVALNPANSGTSTAPITFRGVGAVNIYLAAGYAGPTIGAVRRDYITWDNIRIDEQTAQGVSCADTGPVVFNDSTGGKVLNSTIRGTFRGWGDNYNAIRLEAVSGVTIANNTISDVTGDFGHNDAAIMTYDVGNTVIEHNRIFNSACGIYIKGDHDYPQWPNENVVVRFNLFENNSNKGIFHNAGLNAKIYQNVVRGSETGIRLNRSTQTNDSIVANNTVSATLNGVGLALSGDFYTGNLRVHNNIFSGPAGEQMNGGLAPLGNTAFAHNVYFGHQAFGSIAGAQISFSVWQTTHGQETSAPPGVVSDPLFVNAASFNFRLQAGSPARNRGVDLLDLNQNGSAVDLIPAGAYITGSEDIGPTVGGTLPARLQAPRNLRFQ